MAIDVAAEVLSDPDFLISITVRTASSSGGYVDGHYQDGTTGDIDIQASVQPAQAEDFINVEEGERFGGSQVIYSFYELKGSKDLKQADLIIGYLGVNWKVVQVEPWGHHGYFKSIIVKVDD